MIKIPTQIISNIVDKTQSVFYNAVDQMKLEENMIADKMDRTFSEIKIFFESHAEEGAQIMKNGVKNAIKKLNVSDSSVFKEFTSKVFDSSSTTKTFFNKLINETKSITNSVEQFVSVFESRLKNASSEVKDLGSSFLTAVKNLDGDFNTHAENLFSFILSPLFTDNIQLADSVKSIIQDIKNFDPNTILTSLTSLKNEISKVVGGLKNVIPNIENSLGMVNNTWSETKNRIDNLFSDILHTNVQSAEPACKSNIQPAVKELIGIAINNSFHCISSEFDLLKSDITSIKDILPISEQIFKTVTTYMN